MSGGAKRVGSGVGVSVGTDVGVWVGTGVGGGGVAVGVKVGDTAVSTMSGAERQAAIPTNKQTNIKT